MSTQEVSRVRETEVVEKAKRRGFTAEYKRRILEEADRARAPGGIGALLRRGFLGDFFRWYNEEHHHSGLELLTPADVHHGRTIERLAARAQVLAAAFAAHPERFPRGIPSQGHLPPEVWINRPVPLEQAAL